ncbi:hypothetical protein BDP81DRAFT_15833 [Colletotrichum phormii]|uniref:Uncharacterized protein n=1 Tax=Colletotrichum phormii TaxID=359342 RepID=A0AAJ0A4V4_9PEZI|nr:uncharacterized protein BDP81DRAFT_15833 [Colletotrichum phormii]KAK1656129.1 hypothetical protein BDP81DRAFT_15833 [Colletotrichum phormii]
MPRVDNSNPQRLATSPHERIHGYESSRSWGLGMASSLAPREEEEGGREDSSLLPSKCRHLATAPLCSSQASLGLAASCRLSAASLVLPCHTPPSQPAPLRPAAGHHWRAVLNLSSIAVLDAGQRTQIVVRRQGSVDEGKIKRGQEQTAGTHWTNSHRCLSEFSFARGAYSESRTTAWSFSSSQDGILRYPYT